MMPRTLIFDYLISGMTSPLSMHHAAMPLPTRTSKSIWLQNVLRELEVEDMDAEKVMQEGM